MVLIGLSELHSILTISFGRTNTVTIREVNIKSVMQRIQDI